MIYMRLFHGGIRPTSPNDQKHPSPIHHRSITDPSIRQFFEKSIHNAPHRSPSPISITDLHHRSPSIYTHPSINPFHFQCFDSSHRHYKLALLLLLLLLPLAHRFLCGYYGQLLFSQLQRPASPIITNYHQP